MSDMSFQKIITILKGGPTSGNWGHSGRPGKLGGSNKGGGHRRIGFDSATRTLLTGTPNIHGGLRVLAQHFRNQRNELKPVIEAAAKELGYDPNRIEYAGEPFAFKVGEEQYVAGGTYHPDTRRIRLYKGAFTPDRSEVYKGLLAHEIQHDRWNSFMKKAQEQDDALNERLTGEYKAGIHYTKSFMKPDGTIRDPKEAKKYEAQQLRSKIFQEWEMLEKSDGMTEYSKSYWKSHMTKRTSETFNKALNETLAEAAHLKTTGQWDKVKSPWKGLYNKIAKYAEP